MHSYPHKTQLQYDKSGKQQLPILKSHKSSLKSGLIADTQGTWVPSRVQLKEHIVGNKLDARKEQMLNASS